MVDSRLGEIQGKLTTLEEAVKKASKSAPAPRAQKVTTKAPVKTTKPTMKTKQ